MHLFHPSFIIHHCLMRTALIIIGHFKATWNELSEEEQAAFVTQVGRTARRAGVTPVVGYKLTTPGSFIEVWEADDSKTIDVFINALDGIGYKRYYDEVLMRGERAGNWIAPEASSPPIISKEPPAARRDQIAKPAARVEATRRKKN